MNNSCGGDSHPDFHLDTNEWGGMKIGFLPMIVMVMAMMMMMMMMMKVKASQSVQIMVMSESKNDEDADGGETEIYNFKLKIDRCLLFLCWCWWFSRGQFHWSYDCIIISFMTWEWWRQLMKLWHVWSRKWRKWITKGFRQIYCSTHSFIVRAFASVKRLHRKCVHKAMTPFIKYWNP